MGLWNGTKLLKSIEIRKDISCEAVRKYAKSAKDCGVCRRLLGIAHLLEGGSRKEAQKIACLTHNTFRTWLHRFNERGVEGLEHKKHTGRPKKISEEIDKAIKEKVLQGPSEEEGLVRYRIADIKEFLERDHQIRVSLSTLWYKLQALGLSWKTGRQRHPLSDEESQEAFKKTSKMSFKLFRKSTLIKP